MMTEEVDAVIRVLLLGRRYAHDDRLANEMVASPSDVTTFASSAYEWLCCLDPSRFRAEHGPDVATGLRQLTEDGAALDGLLDEGALQATLAAFLAALPDEPPSGRTEWLDVRVGVTPLYEAFALEVVESGGTVKHVHPTNFLRSAVHLSLGLAVVFSVEFVFTQFGAFLTVLAFVIWAWSLEFARRQSETVNAWCMRFFGPIARDHETYRVNSATWYGSAIFVLSIFAFGPAGVLGLLALAVGDPVAGLIGRRYGHTRLPGGKSLEGSLAFMVAASLAGFLHLSVFHTDLGGPVRLFAMAWFAGILGAVVEVLSTRLEDNFTIPVVVGLTLQFLLA